MKTFKLFNEFQVQQSTPKQLTTYLKQKQIPFSQKAMRNSVHIKSEQKGFQIEYQEQDKTKNTYKLSSIFLYFKTNKFNSYSQLYSLPFNLYYKMSIKAVVMLLGEPIKKSKYGLQCNWSYLGIDVVFVGGGWADQNASIDYICLYQCDQKLNKCCSICHRKIIQKSPKLQCQDCKIINYCSRECKQKHYRLHKMYCQSIDEN